MQFFTVLALTLVVVVACNAHTIYRRAAGDQQPKIWDALRQLRGGKTMTTEEMQNLLTNAVPGTDYPINTVLPDTPVDCTKYKQPGFYADDSAQSRCQVFHRCEESGEYHSFLCPNQTLFNQITLVCDWFVNVDCSVSSQFVDYSNSRLGDATAAFLDDQMVVDEAVAAATGAVQSAKVKPAASKPAANKPAAYKPARGGRELENANAANGVNSLETKGDVASEATAAPAAEEETTTEAAAAGAASEETTEAAAETTTTEMAADTTEMAAETTTEMAGETTSEAAAAETTEAAATEAATDVTTEAAAAGAETTEAAATDVTTEAAAAGTETTEAGATEAAAAGTETAATEAATEVTTAAAAAGAETTEAAAASSEAVTAEVAASDATTTVAPTA